MFVCSVQCAAVYKVVQVRQVYVGPFIQQKSSQQEDIV